MMRRWLTLLAAMAVLWPAVASACDCCAKNATAADCVPGTRLETRSDCACCAVCAVEKGGRCDGSDRPCRRGLDCSSQGLCTDEIKCRSDGECASDRFCLGGVCFDPCTILDPCNSSLKNGVCRTRSHRPVCSCPQGFVFRADQKACVKVGCEDESGNTVDVGERIFSSSCAETCVCDPSGRFNCTPTVCPPGFYLPGAFKDDPDCTELPSAGIAGGCCVNVVCSEPALAQIVENDESAASSTADDVCTYVVCGSGAVCDAGICSCRPGLTGDPNDLAFGCSPQFREASASNDVTPTATTTAALEPTTTITTAALEPTTTTTTAKPTPSTTTAVLLDLQPLYITHNSTVLQLPSIGGDLSYQAEGGPPRQVVLSESARVVTVNDLQPGTSYTFSWRGDAGTKSLGVDTRPGCVTNITSHAIGETYHMGCQSTCVCGGPNQPSCRPRCSFTRGTVTDKSCSERPDVDDPECCVQLVCAVTSSGGQIVDNIFEQLSTTTSTSTTDTTPETTTIAATTTTTTSTTTTTTTTTASSIPITSAAPSSTSSQPAPAALMLDSAPKPTLIVTTKSFSSVTLAWDDFKPPAYLRGYVAQYRRVGDDEWRRQALAPQEGQSVPLVRITDLVPATEYQARVSIYDGAGETLGETTETIRFITDDGCIYKNSTYAVGGQFYKGCEETCFCELRGRTRCVPRCQRPLFRSGAFSEDPLCFERRQDECCVIVTCASAPAKTDSADKGDDLCAAATCGDNFICQVMSKEAERSLARAVAMCVCPEGFRETNEPDGKACVPAPAVVTPVTSLPNVTGCTYGNSTYQPGDSFFDGCDYKCLCNSDEEVECQARCARRNDAVLADGCRLEPDPEDGCCKISICENGATTAAASSTEESDYLTSATPSPAETTPVPTTAVPITAVSTVETTTSGDTITDSTRDGRLDDFTGSSPGSSSLEITEVLPESSDSSQLRLRISESVLDSILSAQTLPVLVEWRYSEMESWQQRSISIDDIGVESLDTLVMTVPGLKRPRQSVVRARYDSEVSAAVRGQDVVPADAPRFAEEVATTETATAATTPVGSPCGDHDPGFRCGDGACIPLSQRCDFLFDCGDESDEQGCDDYGEVVSDATTAPSFTTPAPAITTRRPADGTCFYNGQSYQRGDEFHDGCEKFCICTKAGVHCSRIRCPHRLGLSIINPDCLEWDMKPNVTLTPPDCCPEVKCLDDGHCEYKNETFRNQDEIPQRLSGCEQRCFCEFGNVACQPDCPPISEVPPATLGCDLTGAELVTGPNGCCKFWQCITIEVTTEPYEPEYTEPPPESIDLLVAPVSSNSVVIAYDIPSYLVGVPGKTEVFYTSHTEDSADRSLWNRRVFETPLGVLDQLQYNWTLGDLMSGSSYLVQTRVVGSYGTELLRSDIVTVTTPTEPTQGTTLPPKVPVDAELEAAEINTTWAKIGWRRLTEKELMFIDGIQLRYRDVDVDAQVWTMTPFIHRELTTYELTDLKAGTGYEVDIVLMPFQDKNTEMVSLRPLRIRTPPVVDLYDFNVTLLLSDASERSVRVGWSGIPQPQYQYVNVYRIVYIDEKEREERHTFKLAKTSDRPSLLLKGLKPSSKYQVWLEAYLKNGKKRVSEVQEFVTKPGELGKAEQITGNENDVTSSREKPSYYSGMVAASVVAAIAILLCLLVLALLLRKSSRAKAPITPARKNGPSYENPAFKPSNSFETIPRENSHL